MSEKILLPGVADDVNRTLNLLLEQLEQTRSRNLMRSRRYDNKHLIRKSGRVIPDEYFRLNIALGWAAKGVDSLARRTNLDSFVWPDGDLASIGGDTLWNDNMLGSEVDQGLISSLIHGTAFVVNTKGGPDEAQSLIHFRSALDATGVWSSRARRLTSFLTITERDQDGKPTALNLYLNNRTIPATKEDGRWKVGWVSEHKLGVPAEPLPYKPRLERPFGSSRLSRAANSYQDQATRAVIRLEGHMDIFSYPEFWMLGADLDIFENGVFDAMLGRIKGIPDDPEAEGNLARADVKQFQAASPEPHLKRINAAAKGFARIMSLPDEALAIEEMSNPTSEGSYVASREDLIAEAEGATDDWSPYLRRAHLRGLAILNGLDEIPAEWRSIDAKWRSPMYLSRAQEADAGAKQIGAIPWLAETTVGLELLGLDDQQIKRAMSEKRRAQGTRTLTDIRNRAEQRADASGSSAIAPN